MNPRATRAIFIAVAAAIIAFWWWGGSAEDAPASALAAVAKSPAPPATPGAPSSPPHATAETPQAPQRYTRVEAPALPPQTTTVAPGKPLDKPPARPLTQEDVRRVRNNLRQFSSASQQYMIEHGVTEVSYYQIVGVSTDDYLRPIESVAGEEYEDLTMAQTQSEISIVAPDGTNVTFEN